ncbi:MAG: prepilin-type N-terminal cleavage/methylation domain-containing protein [Candidatus Eremiobacteraeota bacterium]|nr:prepilin-type N-terminal cleavage/methylation domain-containing protein [Candidatus Eremiobacteraeota bacterium]
MNRNGRESIFSALPAHRRHREGFTLSEVIVSTALTAMMLLFIYATLLMIMRWWNMGTGMIHIQQSASVAVVKLASQLKCSAIGTITTVEGGAGDADFLMAFASPQDDRGEAHYDHSSGRPLWQKYVVYALVRDAENPSLYRLMGRDYYPSYTITGALSQDNLKFYYTTLPPESTCWTLADRVANLNVDVGIPLDNVSVPRHTVTVSLTTSEEVKDIYGKTTVQKIEVRTKVVLRN